LFKIDITKVSSWRVGLVLNSFLALAVLFLGYLFTNIYLVLLPTFYLQ